MSRMKWPITMLAVLVVLAGVAVAAQAAPLQQMTYNWENIGQSNIAVLHTAAAFDTDNNAMYVYGGTDENFAPVNSVMKLDISDPADLRATASRVSAGGALSLVGSAGAYRAKGKDSDDSAAYFFGGLNNPQSGQASNNVQRYGVKSGTWERLDSTITNNSEFKDRFFAGAAYDPVHDVFWVVGGISNCSLPSVIGGQTCNARPLPTQYLSFDATTGDMTWNTLAGGDQSFYAHSVVYDDANKQLLAYGGTKNISRGERSLMALDLADADPAKATWKTLSTTGSGPAVYFHCGAFDAAHSMMVIYGGVSANFMQSNETAMGQTWALDMTTSPDPTWVNLSPRNDPGDRIAGAMGYDPLHSAAIFTLGRAKFNAGEPLPSQNVQRSVWGLVGMVVPTTEPPTAVPPTVTPGGSVPTATPPPPTVPLPADVCDIAKSKVPNQVLADAVANPSNYYGYDLLCNPNAPEGPWNQPRRMLSLTAPSSPFHPLYNSVEWKCGCP